MENHGAPTWRGCNVLLPLGPGLFVVFLDSGIGYGPVRGLQGYGVLEAGPLAPLPSTAGLLSLVSKGQPIALSQQAPPTCVLTHAQLTCS